MAAGEVGAVGLAHAAAATTARAVTVVRTIRRAGNDIVASWCGMDRIAAAEICLSNNRARAVTSKDQNGNCWGHCERSSGQYGMRHRFVIGVSSC